MANAPKMQNIHGSANSYLKVASKKDASSSLVNSAVKTAPKEQLQLVLNILAAIHALFAESDSYQLTLDSRSTDVVLGRIASLLESYEIDNLNDNLEEAKSEILDAVNGLSIDSIIKTILISGIAELFDNDAKKEDIEELKVYFSELFSEKNKNDEQLNVDQLSNEEANEELNQELQIEDEKVGEYQDSTIALNFSKLQEVISAQFALLNENLKNIPGQGGFGAGMSKIISTGFNKIMSLTASIGLKVSKVSSSVAGITKNLAGNAIDGIMKVVKGISGSVAGLGLGILGAVTAVKGIGSGLKGLGSSIGNMISSPFKKIGSFFNARKLKNAERAQAKKEAMREKFMNVISSVLERLWNFVEPILSKVKFFMLLALPQIIAFSAFIVTVLAVIGLITFAIYKAYTWIKKGIFWKKIGEMFAWLWKKIVSFLKWVWDNLPEWLGNLWGWLKDLGGWLWEKLCDFGGWIWDNLPGWLESLWSWTKDFGGWLWEKLCDFGKWLWELIKDGFKKTWSWICDIGGTIRDAVVRWWLSTPLYKTIEEIKSKGFGGWFKEKLQNFIDGMLNIGKKLKDWWDNTTVGKWLAGLQVKMQNLIKSIGETIWDLGVCYIRPFGFLVGKPITLNDLEKEDYKKFGSKLEALDDAKDDAIDELNDAREEIEKLKHYLETKDYKGGDGTASFGRTKEEMERDLEVLMKRLEDAKKKEANIDKKKAEINAEREQSMKPSIDDPSIPKLQITNAMKPINSINNMNQDTNLELQKTGSEMSLKAAEALAATDDFRLQLALIGSQSLNRFDDLEKKLDKYGNDPAVVPLPVPYGPQRNAAMMENN